MAFSEAQDVVFCHTCVKAFRTKRMNTSHNAAAAFVSTHMQHIQLDNCTHINCLVILMQVIKGYCNWKDATRTFKKHKESKTHLEAVEAMITLPKSTPDVGELLSSIHKNEKEEARNVLKTIISSVRFLGKQGLALRGHDEEQSNLVQLLRLRAEDNPLLGKWLERTWRKFTSHENQNEFLEVIS